MEETVTCYMCGRVRPRKELRCVCNSEYITTVGKGRGNAPTITPEQEEMILDKINGKKESDNKLSYELDRYFIEAMAKRMDQHKGKYAPYNRQKPMDVQKLKQALLRHTIEVMKGNYTDIEDYDHNGLGHIMGIACNSMFLFYQLRNVHSIQDN